MKFKRALVGVASAALLFPSLAACGGGNDFCEQAPDVDASDPGAVGDALEGLVDDAPEEIKDDLQVMVDEFNKFEEDPTTVDAEALTEASNNLVAWTNENCDS